VHSPAISGTIRRVTLSARAAAFAAVAFAAAVAVAPTVRADGVSFDVVDRFGVGVRATEGAPGALADAPVFSAGFVARVAWGRGRALGIGMGVVFDVDGADEGYTIWTFDLTYHRTLPLDVEDMSVTVLLGPTAGYADAVYTPCPPDAACDDPVDRARRDAADAQGAALVGGLFGAEASWSFLDGFLTLGVAWDLRVAAALGARDARAQWTSLWLATLGVHIDDFE
jgi:hypothetical protein